MANGDAGANGETGVGKGHPDAAGPARRRVLMLGAAAASTVVTIRPALAQTATSVLNCRIPVPDDGNAGKWLNTDGKLVDATTPGAVRPVKPSVTGEEARQLMAGKLPPGFDVRTRDAYVRYIRRLRQGTSGFTCFASVQMLRP